MMSANLEDLLRDGMTRFTAEIHAPTDLARRARRHRNRRLALRAAAAGGTAMIGAAAIAVAAITAGGTGGTRPGAPALTAAYVTGRVRHAVAVAELRDVERTELFAIRGGRVVHMTDWTYRNEQRSLITSASGLALGELGWVRTPEPNGSISIATTVVADRARMWAHQTEQARIRRLPPTPASRACKQPPVIFPPANASALRTWISQLRELVSCGAFTLAGRQFVHGVDALKLVKASKTGVAETIWVDPSSYLPLRLTLSARDASLRFDISWLRPTAANLQQLRTPIPAGFRQATFGVVFTAIYSSIV
jgi:hypothetical protein